MAAPSNDPSRTTSYILSILTTRGEADYIGEPISQLEHSLQCAHLAAHAGADDETITAALLHDIGQFLDADEAQRVMGSAVQAMRGSSTNDSAKSRGANPDSGSVGRVGHEAIGASFLAELAFPKKVCALVGSHVAAKRFLCAVEPGYYDTLSEASKASLAMQGGPMDQGQVAEWKQNAWWQEMARLRKWDDRAKVVGLDVPNVEGYRSVLEGVLRKAVVV